MAQCLGSVPELSGPRLFSGGFPFLIKLSLFGITSSCCNPWSLEKEPRMGAVWLAAWFPFSFSRFSPGYWPKVKACFLRRSWLSHCFSDFYDWLSVFPALSLSSSSHLELQIAQSTVFLSNFTKTVLNLLCIHVSQMGNLDCLVTIEKTTTKP